MRAIIFLSILFISLSFSISIASFTNEEEEEREQSTHKDNGEGRVLDDSTREAILVQVDEEGPCRGMVEDFLNGRMNQKDMSHECQEVLMRAFSSTPVGQLQAREQQSVFRAAVTRLSSGCQGMVRMATSDADVGEECKVEMKQQVQAMQGWLFNAMVGMISNECKDEIAKLRAEAKGKELSRACLGEIMDVKPGALDTLDAQTSKREEDPQAAGEEDMRQHQQFQNRRTTTKKTGGGDASSGDESTSERATRPSKLKRTGSMWSVWVLNSTAFATVLVPILYAYYRYFKSNSQLSREISDVERERIKKQSKAMSEKVQNKKKRLGLL